MQINPYMPPEVTLGRCTPGQLTAGEQKVVEWVGTFVSVGNVLAIGGAAALYTLIAIKAAGSVIAWCAAPPQPHDGEPDAFDDIVLA